jgi:hypothetical protein
MNKYAFLTEPVRKDAVRAESYERLAVASFQRLIDWSIDETGQDVCAVITGPNGFYKKHRIKASRDFGWIEKESASEVSLQLG